MSPLITPRPKATQKPTSIRLPDEMLERLKAIESDTERSRTDVIVELLQYALDREYPTDAGKKPKK